MQKVTKVLMFPYRIHGGKRQFFVLHRHRGDKVVLTGHIGDHVGYENETPKEAARREIVEELGVKPLELIDACHSSTVKIPEHDIESTEHAFLVKIPDQNVKFLEHDEPHQWHRLEELSKVLTYLHQRQAATIIKKYLNKSPE